jgi:predicted aspartyl protease
MHQRSTRFTSVAAALAAGGVCLFLGSTSPAPAQDVPVAALAPAPAHATGAYATAVTLPLEISESGHVIVAATVEGVPARFLMDTGASHTLIDADSLERLGGAAKNGGRANVKGGGKVSARQVTLRPLNFGGYPIREMPAVSLDLPDVLGCDGLLGKPFFDSAVVTIDYVGKTVTLSDPARFVAAPGALALPMEFDGGIPTVAATFDGNPVRFKIDTGSVDAVTLFPPFVEKQKLLGSTPLPSPIMRAPSAGRCEDTRREYRPSPSARKEWHPPEQLAGALPGPPEEQRFHVEDGCGKSGGAFMEAVHADARLSAPKLFAARNAEFDTPFPFFRSGITYKVTKEGGIVSGVSAGSPAADAGIVEGDILKKVDGKPVEDATRGYVRARLSQPAGTKVVILLQPKGNGVARPVELTLRDLL